MSKSKFTLIEDIALIRMMLTKSRLTDGVPEHSGLTYWTEILNALKKDGIYPHTVMSIRQRFRRKITKNILPYKDKLDKDDFRIFCNICERITPGSTSDLKKSKAKVKKGKLEFVQNSSNDKNTSTSTVANLRSSTKTSHADANRGYKPRFDGCTEKFNFYKSTDRTTFNRRRQPDNVIQPFPTRSCISSLSSLNPTLELYLLLHIQTPEQNSGENYDANKEPNTGDNEEQNMEDNEDQNMEDNEDQNMEDNEEQNTEDYVEQNMEDNEEQNIKGNEEQNIEDNEEQHIENNEEQNIEDNQEQNIEDNEEQNIEDNEKSDSEQNTDDSFFDILFPSFIANDNISTVIQKIKQSIISNTLRVII